MQKVGNRVKGVLDFFSVGSLAGSLFAPYRQISAGRVRGPIGVQLRAWGDRLFSRIMGAIIRLLLILTGLVTALVIAAVGGVVVVVWPFLPAMPLISLFLMQVGAA